MPRGEIVITVDVNGYGQGPNVYGRDTFVFVLDTNDNLVPMELQIQIFAEHIIKTVLHIIQGVV